MTKHENKRKKDESPEQRRFVTIQQTIGNMLLKKGYTFETDCCVGFDVYGDEYYVHYFIRNLKNFENGLAIEIIVSRKRWKNWEWDVIMGNIKDRIPCPVILVYPDEGLPAERLQFLKKNIDQKQLLHVFTLAEFLYFWESEDHPRRLPSGNRENYGRGSGERMTKTTKEKLKSWPKNRNEIRKELFCQCPHCPTYLKAIKKESEVDKFRPAYGPGSHPFSFEDQNDDDTYCLMGFCFRNIEREEVCLCPRCAVQEDLVFTHLYYCMRGCEKAQRYDEGLGKSSNGSR